MISDWLVILRFVDGNSLDSGGSRLDVQVPIIHCLSPRDFQWDKECS